MSISHEPSAKASLGKYQSRGIDRKNKNEKGQERSQLYLVIKKKLIYYSTELLRKKSNDLLEVVLRSNHGKESWINTETKETKEPFTCKIIPAEK